MDLSRFPRRRYTPFATPIELLPHFTKALAASCPGGVGPEIWIKRDDMLGLFPGGNKTRKLEFLAADALAQGADTLITCGAPQSNHCRITLAAAVKEGLRCRFIIEERVPGSFRDDATGNHFLFRLMGVESLRVVPAGSDLPGEMEAEAVLDLLGVAGDVPEDAVRCVGGYWQPKYSVPNARMVEAVQVLARTEGVLLDPVYTGKVMAGLIGLARGGAFENGSRVLFM